MTAGEGKCGKKQERRGGKKYQGEQDDKELTEQRMNETSG